MAGSLVLIRHGESEWNASNRFAGWIDVELTARGACEAREAGRLLRRHGWRFHSAHASLLKRAQDTLRYVLEEMGTTGLSIARTWRLNERHYGLLQGLDRAEAAARFGEDEVRRWRRSLDARPPALPPAEAARLMPAEALADTEEPIAAESLRDTVRRVEPFWRETLTPALRSGRQVLVVAHGNSIRALMVHIEALADADFPGEDIPHATPRTYEFDPALRVLHKGYLQAWNAIGEFP